MLNSALITMNQPRVDKFGYKHLKDTVKYLKTDTELRPIDYFLGNNVYRTRITWIEQDNNKGLLESNINVGTIPVSTGNSIDNLSIDFVSWTNLIGHDILDKPLSYIIRDVRFVPAHYDFIGIPVDVDIDAFVKEIEDWCVLNNLAELELFFDYISNVRYGSDTFSNLRKTFKEVIDKPIRSASAYEDAKRDLWDELEAKPGLVFVKNVLKLTTDELQGWFQHKYTEIKFIHESQLIEAGLPVCLTPLKKNKSIIVGKIDKDTVEWRYLTVSITHEHIISFKYHREGSEFDAIVSLENNKRNYTKPEAVADALEECKKLFKHNSPENSIGSMLSIPMEHMQKLIDFLRKKLWSSLQYPEDKLIVGVAISAPNNEYADTVQRNAKINFGFKELHKLHYQFAKGHHSSVTISEIKKLESLISHVLPSICDKEISAAILKEPLGSLREERLDNLGKKLEQLYFYIEPYVEEYIKNQLGTPKSDRAFFVRDAITGPGNYDACTSIQQNALLLLTHESRDYTDDRLSYTYICPKTRNFASFVGLLKRENITGHRTTLDAAFKESCNLIESCSGESGSVVQIGSEKVVYKSSSIYTATIAHAGKTLFGEAYEPYGELKDLRDLLSLPEIIQAMVYTKITLSVEDGTFLNLNHKGTFVRAQDAIVDWLDSTNYKGICLVSSIYA